MEQEKNDATSLRQEKSVVRRIVTSKLFLIAVSSIVIYTLAGFFLLPYILESQLKSYVAENLNRTLQIEKIQLNPYIMTLEISDLKLKEADDERILSFDRFFIDFELKSLFRWAWSGVGLFSTGIPAFCINFNTLMPNPDMEGRAYWGFRHSPCSESTRHAAWLPQKIILHDPPAKAFDSVYPMRTASCSTLETIS